LDINANSSVLSISNSDDLLVLEFIPTTPPDLPEITVDSCCAALNVFKAA